jgi:hypothetical protein
VETPLVVKTCPVEATLRRPLVEVNVPEPSAVSV